MAREPMTVNVKLDDGEVSRIVRMVAREVGRNAERALLNRNIELEERIDELEERLAKLIPVALHLADEAEVGRRRSCWRGDFASCDNGGCVKARELIAEARSYGSPIANCVCREPDPSSSTHSYTCMDANGHNEDCPSFCPDRHDASEKLATGGIVTGTYVVGEHNRVCVFPKAQIPEGAEVQVPEEWKQLMPFLDDEHPEKRCNRCGGPNVSAWCAPSPLWNQVMRGGDINGKDLFDGIVCPVCFAALAEEAGIAQRWMFYAEKVLVPLQTTTPSGRTWNEQTWLWDDAEGAEKTDD